MKMIQLLQHIYIYVTFTDAENVVCRNMQAET